MCLLGSYLCAASPIYSQENNLSVLLISLEQYSKDKDKLDYVTDDLSKLAEVFYSRYGVSPEICKDANVKVETTGIARYKESIASQIEIWCRRCKENQLAILYLAGHGIVDHEGKLCIPMINFSEEHNDNTSIRVEWIREQLNNKCKAKNKLLILDTCYSGTARGDSKDLIPISRMAEDFNGGDQTAAKKSTFTTLASSKDNQKSWLWKEKMHSLFTYWLIEGLKGNADNNENNIISLNELVDYLELKVPDAAMVVHKVKQNPIVLNKDAGKDIQFHLQPIAKNDCIEDLDNLIDTELRLCQIERVCAPEFSAGSEKFKIDRNHFGLLTKGIPYDLTQRLCQRSRPYTCLPEDDTLRLLKDVNMEEYGTAKTRKLTLSNGDPVPAIIQGHIYPINIEGGVYRCVCRIRYGMKTTQDMIGIFYTTDNVIPKIDKHGNKTEEKEPDFETIGMSGVSFVRSFAKNETAPKRNAPHPLSPEYRNLVKDQKAQPFPYDIWIGARKAESKTDHSGYEKRDFKFDENQCSVTLKKGEEYAIFVQNDHHNEDLFFAVLVDGLSTQSQITTHKSKDLKVVPNTDKEEIFAPRVNLLQARNWVQSPDTVGGIYGFYQPTNKVAGTNKMDATLRRFTVVDANKSLAARARMTEQIGLITIGLFKAVDPGAPGTTKGGVGTDAGPAQNVELKEYSGKKVAGPLMAVINIHYQEEN